MEIIENHKRRIESTFWMLDKLLYMFEQWVNGHEVHGILYDEKNILSDEQRHQLQNEINSIRALLAEVKTKLELKGFKLNIGEALQGLSGLYTENLEELQGKRLSGYGAPQPELTAYLDPKLAEFISCMQRIAKIGTEAIQNNEEN